jgi:hypothetical protein
LICTTLKKDDFSFIPLPVNVHLVSGEANICSIIVILNEC